MKPLWDFLDFAWGNQTLDEGGDDKNDELETPQAEECILAIEDGLTEEATKGEKHEVLSTEKESKEKVENSPTSPSQPEANLCASLKALSVSGPDQDVRQRAKEIRAELIRPPGEGGEYTGASPKFSTEPTSFNRYGGEIRVLNPPRGESLLVAVPREIFANHQEELLCQRGACYQNVQCLILNFLTGFLFLVSSFQQLTRPY